MAVEKAVGRLLHKQLPDAGEEGRAHGARRGETQVASYQGMIRDQPAEMPEGKPFGYDQIARRAVFPGKLDRDMPGGTAQAGDGKLVGDDQPLRVDPVETADAKFLGQSPAELLFPDQAGCQQLRLEIGAVAGSERCKIGAVAGRQAETPQQRQPVFELRKQV